MDDRKVGRPKSLDRDDVLDLAVALYWKSGVDAVSVNEICRQAGVSKPSLYREFANEDGLLAAALRRYDEQAVQPLVELLLSDTPIPEIIEGVIDIVITDRREEGLPRGCMLTPMFDMRGQLGKETQRLVDELRSNLQTSYEAFVARMDSEGMLSSTRRQSEIAFYIATLVAAAMRAVMRGDDESSVEATLRIGFDGLMRGGA